MAERDPNEFSGRQFCGNCGAAVIPGASACSQCGSPVTLEEIPQEFAGGYIPYCRACGVPVAREAALNCAECGVTPLCREHYYPSSRTCALCPQFELTPPGGLTHSGEQEFSSLPNRPNGPWPQSTAAVACPQCGARIRRGVEFCPNCGAEQRGAGEDTEYAGFLDRLGAAFIDLFIIVIPAGIIGAIVEIPAFEWLVVGIYHLFNAYFIYNWGQTPGKKLLNIQVVDTDGNKPNLTRVVLREIFGKIVSRVLLIGYLWVIWDRRKRGWHDYVAGTFVVKREPDS